MKKKNIKGIKSQREEKKKWRSKVELEKVRKKGKEDDSKRNKIKKINEKKT